MFKHKKTSSVLLLTTLCVSVFMMGCEDDELNLIAQAQQCFNNVRDTDPDTNADTCYSIVSGVGTPEAYALKCAIQFRSGGLTGDEIMNAADTYDAASGADKEAVLIEAFALSTPAKATAAQSDCEKSDTPGLIYISSLILLGTNVNAAAGANFDDKIDACQMDPASCATADLGRALVSAESVYCLGDTANETICQELNQAIQTGGSDYQAIADAFLDLIDPS